MAAASGAAGPADPGPGSDTAGLTLNEVAGNARAKYLIDNGYNCYVALNQLSTEMPLVHNLITMGGTGVLEVGFPYDGTDLPLSSRAALLKGPQYLAAVGAMAAHLRTELGGDLGGRIAHAGQGDEGDCGNLLNRLRTDITTAAAILDAARAHYRQRRPLTATIRDAIAGELAKNIPALNLGKPMNGRTLNQITSQLEDAADKAGRKAKRVESGRRKGKGLSTDEQNNNKLCAASVAYAALQSTAESAPGLMAAAMRWKSQTGGPTPLLGARVQEIALSAPVPGDRDLTNNTWLFSGLMARMLGDWTTRYVGKATRPTTNYLEQVPGYDAYMRPTVAEMKQQKFYSATEYNNALQTGRIGVPAGTTVSGVGGDYITNLLLKGADLETQAMLIGFYSLPTSSYLSNAGASAVNPGNLPARFFNNAMMKPRFRALENGTAANNKCDTLARLLDMGGDSCPGLVQMRGTPQLVSSQNYAVDVQAKEGKSRVTLTFRGGSAVVDISLNEPGIGGPKPWPAQGPNQDDVYAVVAPKYQLNIPDMKLEPGPALKMFEKAGAAGQMGLAMVKGLATGYRLPPSAVSASLGSVGRYNVYLQNNQWMTAVIAAALHKWVGDYARLMETYTRYQIPAGPGNAVKTSALLANNDRPAQTAAMLMVNALSPGQLTPSTAFYASDLSNVKKDPKIAAIDAEIALSVKAVRAANKDTLERLDKERSALLGQHVFGAWVAAPGALGDGSFKFDQAHVEPLLDMTAAADAPNVHAFGAGGVPVAPQGSSVGMCLMSAVDTLHDMTPGAQHMIDMARQLAKFHGKVVAAQGGGQGQRAGRGRVVRCKQRGGAATAHDVALLHSLTEELKQMIATEAAMFAADHFLAASSPDTGAECYLPLHKPGQYASITDLEAAEDNGSQPIRVAEAVDIAGGAWKGAPFVTYRGSRAMARLNFPPRPPGESDSDMVDRLIQDAGRAGTIIVISEMDGDEQERFAEQTKNLVSVVSARWLASASLEAEDGKADVSGVQEAVGWLLGYLESTDRAWFKELQAAVGQFGAVAYQVLNANGGDKVGDWAALGTEVDSIYGRWSGLIGAPAAAAAPVAMDIEAPTPKHDPRQGRGLSPAPTPPIGGPPWARSMSREQPVFAGPGTVAGLGPVRGRMTPPRTRSGEQPAFSAPRAASGPGQAAAKRRQPQTRALGRLVEGGGRRRRRTMRNRRKSVKHPKTKTHRNRKGRRPQAQRRQRRKRSIKCKRGKGVVCARKRRPINRRQRSRSRSRTR
jgi:hypothetical protein